MPVPCRQRTARLAGGGQAVAATLSKLVVPCKSAKLCQEGFLLHCYASLDHRSQAASCNCWSALLTTSSSSAAAAATFHASTICAAGTYSTGGIGATCQTCATGTTSLVEGQRTCAGALAVVTQARWAVSVGCQGTCRSGVHTLWVQHVRVCQTRLRLGPCCTT